MSDPGDELVFAKRNLETAIILMKLKIDCEGEVQPLVRDALYLLSEQNIAALKKYGPEIVNQYEKLVSLAEQHGYKL